MKYSSLALTLVLLLFTAAVTANAGESDKVESNCGPKLMTVPEGCATTPKARKQRVLFPESARIANQEGCVVVQLRVFADGSVETEKILKSTNPGWGFEEAARKSAIKWRFKPAKQDGKPIEVSWVTFVDFLIDGPSICNTVHDVEFP